MGQVSIIYLRKSRMGFHLVSTSVTVTTADGRYLCGSWASCDLSNKVLTNTTGPNLWGQWRPTQVTRHWPYGQCSPAWWGDLCLWAVMVVYEWLNQSTWLEVLSHVGMMMYGDSLAWTWVACSTGLLLCRCGMAYRYTDVWRADK